MDLDLLKKQRQKNHGVWTNCRFDIYKEIQGDKAEKRWVLNKLWIWFMQKISKQEGRKIMGIEQTMDLKLVKK